MTNTHRVILNTAALYVKVAVATALTLFTSRFVLAALGVVDFGLYSVVAGVMGFMGFLNAAMSASSQRHLTHELGRGDLVELTRVFNTCFLLHFALAVVFVVVGETVGLWFVEHVLNIPDVRRNAVLWIYQFTVFSSACYVVAVPYQSLLTAHEALVAVSVIGIVQSVLNFILALFITRAPADRLVTYVLISSFIAVLITVAQCVFCRLRYPESRLDSNLRLDRQRTTDLLGFSGWSLFGSLSLVSRLQGVAFLLNIFFGPVVNAAYGISNQIGSFMSQLTQAMQQAIGPRLVKNERAGNRKRMLELSLFSSKYGFFLACFWMIPLYAEIRTVLTLWLKHPPEHSDVFCRIVLLTFVCDQISSGYPTVVVAIGNMARYQTVIGCIHIFTLPLAYFFIKMGFGEKCVLYSSLLTMLCASAARGLVVRQLADLPYSDWLKRVVGPGVIGILPSVLLAFILIRSFPPSLTRLLLLSFTTGLATIIGAFFVGMSRTERSHFKDLAWAAIQKSNKMRIKLLRPV